MSEKDQLDDFLREKLSEREFPFQEAYWESAQALIEADEQHRRRWFVVWLNSMGLLLAGAVLIALVWWGVSATTQTDVASIRHTDTQWIAQAHPKHETVLMSGVRIPNGLPLQTSSLQENREETASLSEVRVETDEIAIPNSQTLQTSSLQENREETASLSEVRVETGEIAIPNSQTLQTSSLQENREETASLSEVRVETDEIAIPSSQTLQTSSLQENREETASLSETRAETDEIPAANPQAIQPSPISLEQQDTSLETERLAPQNTQALRVATLSVIEPAELPSLRVQPGQVKGVRIPQSSVRNKKGRHTIGASLGMSVTNAWPSAESSVDPTVLLTAVPGMYYQYKTAKGISLSMGLQYQSRSGLNVSHSYRSTAFAFGLNEEITTVSPHSLHSLEVPIQIGIPIVGQHRLLVGVDVAYLLNVESEVETVSRNPFGTETRSTESGWGYMQGFKPFDIGIQAGYRYRIGRRMQVGMNLRYGLRDLTDNAFFDQNTVNRNVQIRFVWEQDLFRF